MKFEYNGKTAEEFGLTVTKLDDINMGLSREVIKGNKTKFRARSNHYGTKYTDDIAFSIVVMKNPCNATQQSDFMFTASDIRKINAWLTSPQYPAKLVIENSYYDENIEYNALITDLTVETGSNLYELVYQVQTDAPYALSPKITATATSTVSTPATINIMNNSDELELCIYPVITIEPKAHGEITITNVTDNNRSMTFSALRANTITIDSQRRIFIDYVGDLLTFEDIGITDVGQIKFPRLLPGKNIFQITGEAEITIEYQEARKVGAFS